MDPGFLRISVLQHRLPVAYSGYTIRGNADFLFHSSEDAMNDLRRGVHPDDNASNARPSDLFDHIKDRMRRDLGQFADLGGGIMFPKLEGPIGPWMRFEGRDVLVWSLNNYLGLAHHPEILEADAEAARRHGLASPMGSRMLSGNSDAHEDLESRLSSFMGKESTFLFNYGYPGMVSLIDALTDRNDVIVYDSQSHACIVDGIRMTLARRAVFRHNDMDHLEKRLKKAVRMVEGTDGGILVITEGVFGMIGDLGALESIVELKNRYGARLLVDDAHGFGVMGRTGQGVGEHFDVQDEIDVLFGTFAKAMAGFGAFVTGNEELIRYLKYNLRSQIYAKTLCAAMVEGAHKRLSLLQEGTSLRSDLFRIVDLLQSGLRSRGLDLGQTQSPVTPVYLSGTPRMGAELVMRLRQGPGIFISAVTYPAVEKGVVLLRIMPTAQHTEIDVDLTLKALDAVLAEEEYALCVRRDPAVV